MAKKYATEASNRAVIYGRYSSLNQREESIEAQVRAAREFAAHQGLEIVGIYTDSAKSGTNAEREQFQKMIDDSGKNLFNYVIVHKLDRFSRDKHDSAIYKRKLKINGVRLLSVVENLSDSPESLMLESCLEGMAAYFSANLSREVMKGMRESALKGTHLGGIPPLGYDVDSGTKKYIINEDEAVIVRKIFELYTDGVGYNQILKYLNAMGYRSKRGKEFGKNSLNSILKNEKYTGTFVFNKYLEKDVSGKRNPKLKPKEEWIVVPDALPVIIDKEMFEQAQLKMERNRHSSASYKAKEVYLLSGLIKCGECGAVMYGNTRMCGRNKSNYSSYRCSGRAKHRGCNNLEFRRDYIDNYVLDEIYRRLLSETSIKRLSTMLNDYNSKKMLEAGSELRQAQNELKEITKKIGKVIQLVSESGVSIETVKDNLKELEERKHSIENYISELSNGNALTVISEERINELIYKSRDFIKTHNIPECKNFIGAYVEQVVVFKDKVEILFKIHIPDENDEIVPMKSESETQTLRKEYADVPKGGVKPDKFKEVA